MKYWFSRLLYYYIIVNDLPNCAFFGLHIDIQRSETVLFAFILNKLFIFRELNLVERKRIVLLHSQSEMVAGERKFLRCWWVCLEVLAG
jgi:hypothetical protein